MNQIRLDKAYNFRDIGGYETNEGLVVKKGLLFRSDELSKLSEADIETIRKLNIKTIIDYRSERERVNNEDKPIPGAKVVYLDLRRMSRRWQVRITSICLNSVPTRLQQNRPMT